MTQEDYRAAARAIGDFRFVQAASIAALRLEGKPYLAAKKYMRELASIQKKLEEAAIFNDDGGKMNEPTLSSIMKQTAVPDGWLRAIDEEMVGAHIGVVNASDDYATAKEKLNKLICWHVAAATDPAVNGGWRLVPLEPTEEMLARTSAPGCAKADWEKMISAVVPKPGG